MCFSTACIPTSTPVQAALSPVILPPATKFSRSPAIPPRLFPGHGPLGNKADLTKFRDMLVTARDRVQKLKSAGKSAQEVVAEKPFADLDAAWGKGMLAGDQFVQVVYLAL